MYWIITTKQKITMIVQEPVQVMSSDFIDGPVQCCVNKKCFVILFFRLPYGIVLITMITRMRFFWQNVYVRKVNLIMNRYYKILILIGNIYCIYFMILYINVYFKSSFNYPYRIIIWFNLKITYYFTAVIWANIFRCFLTKSKVQILIAGNCFYISQIFRNM